MAEIVFPPKIKSLLEMDNALAAPIRELANKVGEIVSANMTTFFPGYTDHGVDHINAVLRSAEELVPEEVWEASKEPGARGPLLPADMVVLIGATLLHDIAMHLQPTGFLELISKNSRFRPLNWFDRSHEEHSADRPWHELWADYERETKRFSERKLGNIIGSEAAREWKFQGLETSPGSWCDNDRLIIGEFIRRHHARLAHEIAIFGFPGLPVGAGVQQFPAMGADLGHGLNRFADLIGLVARSHGTSLRLCQAYLKESARYGPTVRPMGSAVLYPMALLRVADYLQIDEKRAPAVLLQLKDPQSPLSVQEWTKHFAVQSIEWADDPRGKSISINPEISLALFLQLKELLSGLQSELDQSTAVLDEAYGLRTKDGLNKLGLSIRRVHTNLTSPSFQRQLSYIPEATGFSTDPNLLALLVEPLYGQEPGVGVRELIQNSIDAVLELHDWCHSENTDSNTLDLPEQDAEVLVDFVQEDNGAWLLKVQDKGIGMKSDTIKNYFLRAGASFRQSTEWANQFQNANGELRFQRSGRFGVGAFAIFLLGPRFQLTTRHVSAGTTEGFEIDASHDSSLISITKRSDLPVGTTIEIELSPYSVTLLGLTDTDKNWHSLNYLTFWYIWNWPQVSRRVTQSGTSTIVGSSNSFSNPLDEEIPGWFSIKPTGFDAVFWTWGNVPGFVCNGIIIRNPNKGYIGYDEAIGWPRVTQLNAPKVAVFDSLATLPLTTQRYELTYRPVPFINELVDDVMLSFIAYSLVLGPSAQQDCLNASSFHPLSVTGYFQSDEEAALRSQNGLLRYIATRTHFIPTDPWLFNLLNSDALVVVGELSEPKPRTGHNFEVLKRHPFGDADAILRWDDMVGRGGNPTEKFWATCLSFLSFLADRGFGALEQELVSSQVIFSAPHKFESTNVFLKNKLLYRNVISHMESQSKEGPSRSTFLIASEGLQPSSSLLETLLQFGFDFESIQKSTSCIYAARLLSTHQNKEPQSNVSKLWSQILGSHAIPFDQKLRRQMIDRGRKVPALQRHIVWWETQRVSAI